MRVKSHLIPLKGLLFYYKIAALFFLCSSARLSRDGKDSINGFCVFDETGFTELTAISQVLVACMF